MTTTILLIRHGQTDWNLEGRMQGHEDIPLNKTGEQQAQALAKRLATWPIQAIYTSDLQRSLKTAVTIGNTIGIKPIINPVWRERDLGALSGLTRTEARTQFPKALNHRNHTKIHPPNGEDHQTLQNRGLTAFRQIAATHPDQMVAVVSHGGLLHVLVAHLIGLPGGEYGRFTIRGNTGLTIAELHGDDTVVTCINDTSHLENLNGTI
ncbi:MAG: histidine phosphatase family protein [Chloroflexi bacterium]|nr:MAG: histidine phosphatase family protein [Chloroflexota bacterium]